MASVPSMEATALLTETRAYDGNAVLLGSS